MIYTKIRETEIIDAHNRRILKNIDTQIHTDYLLCKKITDKHFQIFNELSEMLNCENGYNYTENKNKHIKHFPATSDKSFDSHINKFIGKSKTTYSLSSKPIEEQIKNCLSTAERRYNMTNMCKTDDALLRLLMNKYKLKINMLIPPIEYQYNLAKYECDDIRVKFEDFVDNGRLFYDVIYAIKTENPHCYSDINGVMQDTILICKEFSKKTYHIMYILDDNKLAGCFALKQEIINSHSREMFENKNI